VLDWGCGYGDASFMLRSLRPDLDITSYDVLSSPPWEILAKKKISIRSLIAMKKGCLLKRGVLTQFAGSAYLNTLKSGEFP